MSIPYTGMKKDIAKWAAVFVAHGASTILVVGAAGFTVHGGVSQGLAIVELRVSKGLRTSGVRLGVQDLGLLGGYRQHLSRRRC